MSRAVISPGLNEGDLMPGRYFTGKKREIYQVIIKLKGTPSIVEKYSPRSRISSSPSS